MSQFLGILAINLVISLEIVSLVFVSSNLVWLELVKGTLKPIGVSWDENTFY